MVTDVSAGGGGSRGGEAWRGRGEARRHALDSVHWSESSESDSPPELVSLSSTATRLARIDATSCSAGAPRNVSYRPVFSSQRFSTFRNFIPSRIALRRSERGSGWGSGLGRGGLSAEAPRRSVPGEGGRGRFSSSAGGTAGGEGGNAGGSGGKGAGGGGGTDTSGSSEDISPMTACIWSR